jgi:hypothetical protein
MSAYPPIAVALLAVALANLLACFTFPVCARISNIGRVARVATLFAAFSIAPFMVAWAAPHTAADLLFYCLYCAGLALGSVLTALTRRLRPAAIQATDAEVGSASPIRCRKIAAD